MKVLLVEDSRPVAIVLSNSLMAIGFEVDIVRNGLEAVQQYALEVPDLIFMDLEMPVMNGFEATSRIRAIESANHNLWTPIIFLTAADSTQNIVTAIESGADDLTKNANRAFAMLAVITILKHGRPLAGEVRPA
jgi:CheY-like chemotaxis protein